MGLLILLFFALAALTTFWATCVMLFRNSLNRLSRTIYIIGILGTAVTTYLTTYQYGYFPDANTQILGWPIPLVVFQRESPTAPWLDFVGFTALLAYPMNLLIFLFIPSTLVLIRFAMLRKAHLKRF